MLGVDFSPHFRKPSPHPQSSREASCDCRGPWWEAMQWLTLPESLQDNPPCPSGAHPGLHQLPLPQAPGDCSKWASLSVPKTQPWDNDDGEPQATNPWHCLLWIRRTSNTCKYEFLHLKLGASELRGIPLSHPVLPLGPCFSCQKRVSLWVSLAFSLSPRLCPPSPHSSLQASALPLPKSNMYRFYGSLENKWLSFHRRARM